MDYEKMWKRMRDEMNLLEVKEVQAIAPTIVQDYMGFIEEIEKEGGEK